VKVNVKPVFAQLLHRGSDEGPIRLGTPEDLAPEAERGRGRAQPETFARDLEAGLCSDAGLLGPVYVKQREYFVLSAAERALRSRSHIPAPDAAGFVQNLVDLGNYTGVGHGDQSRQIWAFEGTMALEVGTRCDEPTRWGSCGRAPESWSGQIDL
jgi:hypothetical protein